ncbi:Protein CBG25225 [Caenorhabditis briggsae]|uniref:Protein CBG25225 n=1 Tax=Caenorhabditis briggsae TaxID=6238 RepID=B6IFJ5_CAEBR|nr:Protein CBG25225 [Caenorhabditis briggsae]CAR98675.1 Protein CBG25225 [Caenorhabditis briggsae]
MNLTLNWYILVLLLCLPVSVNTIECLNYRVAEGQPILKAERNVDVNIPENARNTEMIVSYEQTHKEWKKTFVAVMGISRTKKHTSQ